MSISQGAPGSKSLNLRGAVDLSSLANQADSADADGSASSWVVPVTEAELNDVVKQSLTVPVILGVWSSQAPESSDLMDDIAELVRSAGGRVMLATLDAQEQPQVAAALGIQAVPMALALIKGQPVPLFQGVASKEQVSQVLAGVIAMAEQNGVNGKLPPEREATVAETPEPGNPQVEAAQAALAAGDITGAQAAFQELLTANPGDEEALRGLAQVALLQRLEKVDATAVRQQAAAQPQDLDAVMTVADLDLVGGHVEDAFTRLIDAIAAHPGDDRDRLRERLLSLFDVVGVHDDRVLAARRALASALF